MNNLILLTDSYKVTHWKQYPPKTTNVYSYLESRGGQFRKIMFFGLQYILKQHLVGIRVTEQAIDEAKIILQAHFGADYFNEKGWHYILEKHNGQLPIEIKAVAEGTIHHPFDVLMTIENTDPKCFWLTSYLETLLLQVWYPTTVATYSYAVKRLLLDNLTLTGHTGNIDFMLHDFGFRGCSSVESAALGGAAHLINFIGSDTLASITLVKQTYPMLLENSVPSFSIPATEHSTITSWGQESECKAYANFLKEFPTGTVACVSDSFNIYDTCHFQFAGTLRDKILDRDGQLVIRPDSGNPVEVTLKVLAILGAQFGCTWNEKGYRMLNPKLKVIWGDGLDINKIKEILTALRENDWSSDNIAFGMGGQLLQKVDRDTQKFAIKCSSITQNGLQKDVYKDPLTDPGKASKRGRFEGEKLQTVFKDGVLTKEWTWNEVRRNAGSL